MPPKGISWGRFYYPCLLKSSERNWASVDSGNTDVHLSEQKLRSGTLQLSAESGWESADLMSPLKTRALWSIKHVAMDHLHWTDHGRLAQLSGCLVQRMAGTYVPLTIPLFNKYLMMACCGPGCVSGVQKDRRHHLCPPEAHLQKTTRTEV